MPKRIQHRSYNEHRLEFLTIRDRLFTTLGGDHPKCSVEGCNWDDPRALQVDHKIALKDDPTQLSGMPLFRAIIAGRVDKSRYMLLCANHHSIKRAENREHRTMDDVKIEVLDADKANELCKKYGTSFKELNEAALRKKI